jgi:diguanylate cyclase (GGDEF)-like protein/PAS domain S-box-containing protein
VLTMYDSLSSRTLALLRELSLRRRMEEKLRLASNIIESSADGIFITNLAGLITDVNPAYCQHVQRKREELLGQPVAVIMPSLFGSAPGQQVWALATQAGHWAGELSNRRPGGDYESVWLTLSTVKDASQHTLHFVGMLSSISQLVERHHALESAANHDALTGLPNRRLLKDRLTQAMERSKRDGTLLAVCYLDLDQFKPVNDSLGHAVGDQVLCAVAQRMAQALRGADTVARVGGDEFILLLGDLTQPQEARHLLERLLQNMQQPIDLDSHQLQVGASMGATLYPTDASNALELMQHADQMLYLAKAQGRACLRIYGEA